MRLNLMRMTLALIFLLTLNSCTIVPPQESVTVWAKPASEAKIIDDKYVNVVTDKDNVTRVINKETASIIIEGKKSKTNIQGKCIIDESTLTYYKKLHEIYGKDYLKTQAAEKLKSK